MAHQQRARARVAVRGFGPAGAVRKLGIWAGALAHGTGRIGIRGPAGCGALGNAAAGVLLAALLVAMMPAVARAQSQCCLNPTSETTRVTSGSNGDYFDPYASDFAQTANENLNGKTITESKGEAGSDTCYFTNSKVDPVTSVTGGTWPVHEGTWGPDVVGWKETAGDINPVTYYRNQKKAPCMFTLHQELQLSCNPVPYVGAPGNKLTATIKSTSVENCRTEQLSGSSACQTLNK